MSRAKRARQARTRGELVRAPAGHYTVNQALGTRGNVPTKSSYAQLVIQHASCLWHATPLTIMYLSVAEPVLLVRLATLPLLLFLGYGAVCSLVLLAAGLLH